MNGLAVGRDLCDLCADAVRPRHSAVDPTNEPLAGADVAAELARHAVASLGAAAAA